MWWKSAYGGLMLWLSWVPMLMLQKIVLCRTMFKWWECYPIIIIILGATQNVKQDYRRKGYSFFREHLRDIESQLRLGSHQRPTTAVGWTCLMVSDKCKVFGCSQLNATGRCRLILWFAGPNVYIPRSYPRLAIQTVTFGHCMKRTWRTSIVTWRNLLRQSKKLVLLFSSWPSKPPNNITLSRHRPFILHCGTFI